MNYLKLESGARFNKEDGNPLIQEGFDPYTKLLLHNNGDNDSTTIIDSSGSAHTMTATGSAKLKTAQKKFGTASLNVGGYFSPGKVVTPKGSDFYMGTGDFTVELFANWTTWREGDPAVWMNDPCLISCGPSSSNLMNAGWGIGNMYGPLNGFFRNGTIHYVTAALNVPPYTVWTPTLGTWYHIAFVRASGVLKLFIGGTQWGGNVSAAENQTTSAKDLHIGWDPGGGGDSNTFNGYLDEIRVSKGIARYTTDFTPPTAEFSS
jgi:hypothetical protein